MNIKLHYLYRDGSNYKKWAEIVFSNADGLSTETVTTGLREAFLENGIFVAHQVHIPEVFLASEDQLTPDDHCFHEFDSVEATPKPRTTRAVARSASSWQRLPEKRSMVGAHSIRRTGW